MNMFTCDPQAGIIDIRGHSDEVRAPREESSGDILIVTMKIMSVFSLKVNAHADLKYTIWPSLH